MWFWSYIIGLAVDSLLYDTALAVIQSTLFKYFKGAATLLYVARALKQAGIQE